MYVLVVWFVAMRVVELAAEGKKRVQIAEELGIHRSTVTAVLNGPEAQKACKEARSLLYGTAVQAAHCVAEEISVQRNAEMAWVLLKALGIPPQPHELMDLGDATEDRSSQNLQVEFFRQLMEMGERRMLASGTGPAQIPPLFSKSQLEQKEKESRSEPPTQAQTAS